MKLTAALKYNTVLRNVTVNQPGKINKIAEVTHTFPDIQLKIASWRFHKTDRTLNILKLNINNINECQPIMPQKAKGNVSETTILSRNNDKLKTYKFYATLLDCIDVIWYSYRMTKFV